jgi:hypothetical protein
MVAAMLSSPVLITEMELLVWFATYARLPSGVIAIPEGPVPTETVPTTLLLPVSITDTELEV